MQPWWRDAVVYEVHVRSFADSDGNGVGASRGPLVAVLNTANEPVQVEVTGELLVATADGAEVDDDLLTVPAASTAWLRV